MSQAHPVHHENIFKTLKDMKFEDTILHECGITMNDSVEARAIADVMAAKPGITAVKAKPGIKSGLSIIEPCVIGNRPAIAGYEPKKGIFYLYAVADDLSLSMKPDRKPKAVVVAAAIPTTWCRSATRSTVCRGYLGWCPWLGSPRAVALPVTPSCLVAAM